MDIFVPSSPSCCFVFVTSSTSPSSSSLLFLPLFFVFFRGGLRPPQPPRSYLPCWLCFTVFHFIHHPFCPYLLPHLLVTFFFLLFIIFLSVFFLLRPLLKRLKSFVVTFFQISFLPILHYPYYVPFCFLSSSYCSGGADMLAMLHCPFIFFTILSLFNFFQISLLPILCVLLCNFCLLLCLCSSEGGGRPPLPWMRRWGKKCRKEVCGEYMFKVRLLCFYVKLNHIILTFDVIS